MKSNTYNIFIIILASVVVISVMTIAVYSFGKQGTAGSSSSSFSSVSSFSATSTVNVAGPELATTEIITGLSNPWELGFIDEDTFIYTQRGGTIRGFSLNNKEGWEIAQITDVYPRGEGGLTGLAIDKDFQNNRYIYTCMNVTGGKSISVVRWELSSDAKSITDRVNIITDIPANPSGRHSGCRLVTDKKGHLWIGTGDTASDGSIPQNPKNLGGKILRVDREGKGVAGNMSSPFDSRIFSYGHRNVQGITLFDEPVNGIYGYSSEHGTGRDDEINVLKQGNFGWDPVPGYNESRSMTDLSKYPDAIPAIWSSGDPTIAISGMTIVKGSQWGTWDQAVLTAVQKGQHVRLHKFNSENVAVRDEKKLDSFGRVRTIVQGPSGKLYLLTDNGRGQDKIIEINPK